MTSLSTKKAINLILATLAGAAVIFAQGPGPGFHHGLGFGDKVVKGAPYSATALTQHVQVLADGTRVVSNSTGSVYRDSEGRIRREETFSGMGPGGSEGGSHQMIAIHDPVSGVHYLLDPTSHTGHKMSRHSGATAGSEESVKAGHGHPEFGGMHHESASTKEPLGTQTIEGILAEGTRTTFTVPAGHSGNDRAINVVEERWFSPELGVVVLSKRTDPRHGETSFQLTNINRGEQARSLFELPSEYTITEGGPHMGRRIN
jgi:hypothetical protein